MAKGDKKKVHKKGKSVARRRTKPVNYTKKIANLAGASIPLVSSYLSGGKLQLPALKFDF